MFQFELIPTFVYVFMAVVKADGRIDPAELRVIRDFFQVNFDFGPHELASVEREIEACLGEGSKSRHLVQSLLRMPDSLKELLVDCAFDIAIADGVLADQEREILRRLSSGLRLSDAYVTGFRGRLALWHAELTSPLDRSFHRLGLPSDSSLAMVRERFSHIQAHYQGEQLASLGVEYEALARRRLAQITDDYERVVTALSESETASAEETISTGDDEPTLDELGFIPGASARLARLGVTKCKQLTEPGFLRALLTKGLPIDDLAMVGKLKPPSGKGKLEFAQGVRKAIADFVSVFVFEHIEVWMDLQKVPARPEEIHLAVKRRLHGVTRSDITAALKDAEQAGMVFETVQNKWLLTKFLHLPADTVQELWALAVSSLCDGKESISTQEIGWRIKLATIAPARVDFALRSCPQLIRKKPGIYSLNSLYEKNLPSSSGNKPATSPEVGELKNALEGLKASLSAEHWQILMRIHDPDPCSPEQTWDSGELDLEAAAYQALRSAGYPSRIASDLRERSESNGGWLEPLDLSRDPIFAGMTQHEVRICLRMMSGAFDDFALLEGPGLFTASEQRINLWLDQKHRAASELPAPRKLEEVTVWLVEQFVDVSSALAQRIVRDVWKSTVRPSPRTGELVLLSFGAPGVAEELAGVLFDGSATASELLAACRELECRELASLPGVIEVLESRPDVFVEIEPGHYSLWTRLGVRVSDYTLLIHKLAITLWSVGRAVNTRWVLGFFHRHGFHMPWLNETVAMTLVRQHPELLEVVDKEFLRPKSSNYPVWSLENLILESLARGERPLDIESLESDVRRFLWLERDELEASLVQLLTAAKIEAHSEGWTSAQERKPDNDG